MDGIEVGGGKQQAAKASGSSAESAKTIKLAIAIIILLIAAVLIAWNLGVFGSTPAGAHEIDPTVPPEVAAQPTPQIVKPGNPTAPQPNKPKSNINLIN